MAQQTLNNLDPRGDFRQKLNEMFTELYTFLTGAVQSVTGDGVNNDDPANPVISFPSDLITFRTLTANHTLDSTDLANKSTVEIQMNVASANILTIPLNSSVAFPVGTRKVIRQIGAGQTSIVGSMGVTLNSPNGWFNIAYRFSSVIVTKIDTNEWNIEGTLAP